MSQKNNSKKKKRSLVEKERAFDQLIRSQRQKAFEESRVVEELKVTKELLLKAHQELEANIMNLMHN